MEKLNRIIENYPLELKFILICCGSERWKAQDLLQNVNWALFLELLERHRLNTYTYTFIKTNSALFPIDVLDKVNNMQLKFTKRSLLLVSELIKLETIFKKHKIKWLNIKGPAFSFQLYNDITYRQCNDIDILIDYNDVQKTVDLLLNNGFKPTKLLTKQKKSFKQFLKFNKEITLINTITNIPIEIHWKFAPYQKLSSFNFNYYYNNKEIIKYNDFAIPTLNFTEHIKYVCRHGFIHQWNSLYWLVDVGQLLKTTNNIHELKQKSPFVSGAINLYEFLFYNKEIVYNKDLKFALQSIATPNKEVLRTLKWRIKRGFYFANIDKGFFKFLYYLRYGVYKSLKI